MATTPGAALGVDDLIVVDTPDALLIATKDHRKTSRKWCKTQDHGS